MVLFNRCAVIAAGLLVVVASAIPATAQTATTPPRSSYQTPQQVAVIDLSVVFKKYQRFNDLIEDLKQDSMKAQTGLKKRGENLMSQAEKLKTFVAGSPEFKNLEESLAKTKTSLDTDVQIMRKRLAEQESKAYYDIYQEVKEAITYYADRRGYTVVLRYNSTPINPHDLAQVQQGVMRTVIYQKGCDITTPIVQMLNDRYTSDGGTRKTTPRVGYDPSNVPGRR